MGRWERTLGRLIGAAEQRGGLKDEWDKPALYLVLDEDKWKMELGLPYAWVLREEVQAATMGAAEIAIEI
jgi:hypothetical protein